MMQSDARSLLVSNLDYAIPHGSSSRGCRVRFCLSADVIAVQLSIDHRGTFKVDTVAPPRDAVDFMIFIRTLYRVARFINQANLQPSP